MPRTATDNDIYVYKYFWVSGIDVTKLCSILIIHRFLRKRQLFAETCPKSQKIVIITSTPGYNPWIKESSTYVHTYVHGIHMYMHLKHFIGSAWPNFLPPSKASMLQWCKFSAISANFRLKSWRFITNQGYGPIFFNKTSRILRKNSSCLINFFWRKYFLNHNIGPWNAN
jgi:hypothetical protein